MDKTYKEFNELFLDTNRSDAASIDFAYNKALQKMNKLQEYEENLVRISVYNFCFNLKFKKFLVLLNVFTLIKSFFKLSFLTQMFLSFKRCSIYILIS